MAGLQFKKRQSGQVKCLSRGPRHREGWGTGSGWRRLRRGRGLGRGLDPLPRNFFLLFDLKMENFGAVFKLDLREKQGRNYIYYIYYDSANKPTLKPVERLV